VTIYNIANVRNFGDYYKLADTTVDATTLAAGTFLNGPNTPDVRNRTRVLRSSGNGTFDQGGPRTTEFSLRLDF
jgi:hypothetical protein